MYDSDKAMTALGVDGRLTHRTTKPGRPPELWFKQRWISATRPIKSYGHGAEMKVELRFDDELCNGYNTFTITADVSTPASRRRRDIAAGGCMHEEIAVVFPELIPLIKWHLCSTEGPMHYLANTVYHAGDRDCWGVVAGKDRNLDLARSSAIWPEATDEDLMQEPEALRVALLVRLPRLMSEFRSTMDSVGFHWSPVDLENHD